MIVPISEIQIGKRLRQLRESTVTERGVFATYAQRMLVERVR